jgi:hypothetical protein
VLVRYTLYGDGTLNHNVDLTDFTFLAAHFNQFLTSPSAVAPAAVAVTAAAPARSAQSVFADVRLDEVNLATDVLELDAPIR